MATDNQEALNRTILQLLNEDRRASWVHDELLASFAEGVAQSAKDQASFGSDIEDARGPAVSGKELKKRLQYETSRPYDDREKLELIRHALHEVFVTIPSVRLAVARSLAELGVRAVAVEFSEPDEQERSGEDGRYIVSISTAEVEPSRNESTRRFQRFSETLDRDNAS